VPVNIIITTIWSHLISIEYLICISQEEDDESNGREVKENKERKKQVRAREDIIRKERKIKSTVHREREKEK
jgi:hypothetical protein